jgi:hypothetical protein
MKVVRYFYVRAPKGAVAHLSNAPRFVEGELTRCGRSMQAGWLYNFGARNVPKNMAICASCRRV